MKIKIVVGLLAFMVSMNVAGCGGCGTTQEETSVVAETEETEKVIEETEVTENTEEDYADSLVEVEGGDGEDSTETDVVTEEVVESTENEVEETKPVENTNLFNIVDCDPVTKYTNTNANIRAIPDKSGELVDTVTTNTELTVTGTTEDGSWSRTERNGVVCFVKSSLLSDTKTEVKQSSSSGGTEQSQSSSNTSQDNSSSNSNSSPNNQSSSSNSNSVLNDQAALDALLTEMFGNDGQGTGGYDGGTTGSTTDGHYGGVQ